MCTRFFIDFSNVADQRAKLVQYLVDHFRVAAGREAKDDDDDVVAPKYNYLVTLAHGRGLDVVSDGVRAKADAQVDTNDGARCVERAANALAKATFKWFDVQSQTFASSTVYHAGAGSVVPPGGGGEMRGVTTATLNRCDCTHFVIIVPAV